SRRRRHTRSKRVWSSDVCSSDLIGSEEDFRGVVDLINMNGIIWDDDSLGMEYEEVEIPEDLKEQAQKYRKIMIEAIADHDDALMEKYLMEEDISEKDIEDALRKATLERDITTVMCGSALKNKGVQALLDKIVRYLPSPYDIPAIKGKNPEDHEDEMERKPSVQEPFSALAFKIMTD